MINLTKYKTGQWFPARKIRNKPKTVIQRAKSKGVTQSGQSTAKDVMTAKLAIYGYANESQ